MNLIWFTDTSRIWSFCNWNNLCYNRLNRVYIITVLFADSTVINHIKCMILEYHKTVKLKPVLWLLLFLSRQFESTGNNLVWIIIISRYINTTKIIVPLIFYVFTSGTVKVFAITKFSKVKFCCSKCQVFIDHFNFIPCNCFHYELFWVTYCRFRQ